MKKHLLTFVALFVFFFNISAQDKTNMFELSRTTIQNLSVDFSASTDTIFPCPYVNPIGGLSVDMTVLRKSPRYFFRLLLIDTNGNKYVIAEAYKEITDKETLSFSNYGQETILLDSVVPKSIVLYVDNADININFINVIPATTTKSNAEYRASVRLQQLNTIVKQINDYNRSHHKLWAAGVTELSKKSFSERMRLMDIPENEPTGGMEYYVGGIFDIGEPNDTLRDVVSPYVPEFDWRNRHGRNWLTPFKDQGESGFCSSFAAIGALEALINIYNNYKYDLDLSEQEAACCNGTVKPYSGMAVTAPLYYIKNYGVCDEVAYPFVDDSLEAYCKSNLITPNTLIGINNYHYISGSWDNIKNAIIHNGPLSSGYMRTSGGHAMALVGYKTLHVGDTVRIMESSSKYYNYIIEPDDEWEGMTYWVFKNSYSNQAGNFPWRIFNILFYQRSNMLGPYAIDNPTVELSPINIQQICEDRDGDGYYFWGLGPKPDTAPSWVPDEPDGDDSDITKGPMDQYGYLEDLTCGTTIHETVTYNGYHCITCRIGIVNGGKLSINGNTYLGANAVIRVCEGGELIVDGGTIDNAKMVLVPGAKLTLRNGAVINMASGQTFDAPKGVVVNIESGEIN